jgi:predicted nucleic acid-binding protein
MATVCLDTQILIWGLKRQASPGQEDMIDLATRFLSHLTRQKRTCIVPAVVVSELLLPLPLSEHNAFVADIARRFTVPPFDTLTATYLARVWQSKRGQVEIPRPEIKFDSLIVATALAAGANCIYSHDPHVKLIAAGHLDCRGMDEEPMQSSFV